MAKKRVAKKQEKKRTGAEEEWQDAAASGAGDEAGAGAGAPVEEVVAEKAAAGEGTGETAPAVGTPETASGAGPEGEGTEPPSTRVQELERRIKEMENEYREKLAALVNDQTRFRERANREVERRVEEDRNRILLEFLDVMDNFDRALAAAIGGADAGSAFYDGVSMVATMFRKKLEGLGLEAFGTTGEVFNPHTDEAIHVQKVDDPEKVGKITAVWQKGYKVGDRVLRPSRVCVGAAES